MASSTAFKSPSKGDAVWGRLELQMSAGDTTIYELKGEKAQIVGRAAGSDIPIALPHVSATHCTVREAGLNEEGHHVVKIMDLSSNGTCLNREPIGRNLERELREGDVVTFTKHVGQVGGAPPP